MIHFRFHITILLGCYLFLVTSCSHKPAIQPMAEGIFEPNWQSLEQYQTPEWFKNTKFGIWAHWGPQCQPEEGDWYARFMYNEGSREYKAHLVKYGHPSEFGFKDVINEWKADQWQPDSLIALYKRVGAQYFFTLANHHDNFDLWNSDYQEWNSVNMGPRKDIVGEWEKACRKYGLYFGVSVHAAHAWSWMETAQRADKEGKYAGVPYDGHLTKKDGKGKWWEGYDPQELYAQNHEPSEGSLEDIGRIHSQWAWGNGVSVPSEAYCTKFYNRTVDLINKYNPDLIYFDDTSLPLSQISDVGLKIAAHFYNHNMQQHQGKQEGVLFAKVLSELERKCMTWDVERGATEDIQPESWQSCSCLGGWHYHRSIYENGWYKSAPTVIQMLSDITSKNGSLLLSVPMRGNGTIDDKERTILEGIAQWMQINKEAIYDTRPWVRYGEGPVSEVKNPINAQGFNEGKNKYSSQDIRFTSKKENLYAIVMVAPQDGNVLIKSLAKDNTNGIQSITKIELLGLGEVPFEQTDEGLKISVPLEKCNTEFPIVFKI